MRICIAYDCLFPHTVGGAERWYRNLAVRLAREGHDVTYVTRRQWDRGDAPEVEGVRVVVVSPRTGLYTRSGRRRIFPTLLFGLGTLWHLLLHGGRYDVVHMASFPYFSPLAAGLARRVRGFDLAIDWHEVWTRSYWDEYLGRVGGRIGWSVQRACVRLRQRAYCFSRLHARRLREEGFGGEPIVLEGEYAGPTEPPPPVSVEPVVVFAGRHIPEKRVPSLVDAMAELPSLRCEIYGDGPDRDEVLRRTEALGLNGRVVVPGFVDSSEVDAALTRALCMVLPSRREGYGLIVVEASVRGTPSVVVADPDNAATELVDDGENGVIAPSASAADLAAAIRRVEEGGEELRHSTRAWFERNASRLSLEHSLDIVAEGYRSARS